MTFHMTFMTRTSALHQKFESTLRIHTEMPLLLQKAAAFAIIAAAIAAAAVAAADASAAV